VIALFSSVVFLNSGEKLEPNKPKPARYAINMTLAAVAGQVGCLTVVIIALALLAGLWLDNQFGTRPLFLVGLLLASVPVTLITMFWVVRQATSRIQNETSSKPEDQDRGTES
jgi:F0F1-type ATP synthase assembly protein I